MTDAGGDPGHVPQPSFSARVVGLPEHPVTKLVTWAVVTIGAVIAIALSLSGAIGGGEEYEDASSGGSAVTLASTAPPLATGGSGPSGGAVGDCLSDSGEQVACQQSHDREVFSVGPECLMADLTAYLGAEDGVDVVRPDLVVSSLDTGGDPACVVTVPVGADGAPNADALRSGAGSPWRWCEDDISRTTSCSAAHASEMISDEGAASCQDRADEYLGSSFEVRGSDLELATDAGRCAIQVRGTGVLEDSLRRLGARALPLGAAS